MPMSCFSYRIVDVAVQLCSYGPSLISVCLCKTTS